MYIAENLRNKLMRKSPQFISQVTSIAIQNKTQKLIIQYIRWEIPFLVKNVHSLVL